MIPVAERKPRIGNTPLSPLLRSPPLCAEDERRLFEELQNAKRRKGDNRRCRRRFERLRNRIVTANLRLVVAVARPFATPELPLEELVSAGTLPLMRAAELFDPSRGCRFSTYATHSVRNHFLRLRKRLARRRQREAAEGVPRAESLVDRNVREVSRPLEFEEDCGAVATAVSQLSERERFLISARFGFGRFEGSRTFQEVGRLAGLSKERVRVLTHRALAKVRESIEPVLGS